MPSFAEKLIAAHQAGVSERRSEEKRLQEQEDRKFQIEMQKHQLNALKLADKAALRNEQIQSMQLNPNPVAPVLSTSAPQTTTAPIQTSLTDPAQLSTPETSTASNQATPLPLPPVTISGVQGPDTAVPVTSMQQHLQQIAEARRLEQLQALELEKQKAQFTAHVTPEGGTTTFGVPGATPTTTIQGGPKPATEGTIGRGLSAAYFKQKHNIAGRALTDVEQAQADAEYDAFKKSLMPKDTAAREAAAAARSDTRLDKSYQYNDSALNKTADPISQAVARFGRLQDTINQNTPQADALIAPELMTVMAGGQGSGLRINESEIARVIGGRSNLEGLKAALNKWQLDPSKALSITTAQREQIRALMTEVNSKLLVKQQIIEDSRQELINADTVEEHRKIVAGAKAKLNKIDQGGSTGSSLDDEIMKAIKGRK